MPPAGDHPAAEAGILEWAVSPYPDEVPIFDDEDRVGTINPVYAIPARAVDEIKAYFASKEGF